MACADLIVLNKVDLAGREQVARIRAWLDTRFHRYRLIEAVRGQVPLPVLLSLGRFGPDDDAGGHICTDPCCADPDHHHHDHDRQFESWSFHTDTPLSLEALRRAASRLPAGVYRAKGIVHAADVPDRRVILQVVGRRVDISLAGPWGNRRPGSRLVAIGARGSLGKASLRDIFECCGMPA